MRLMKPPFFQVQWGDVVTNTPYRRPTFESFAKWWIDFKSVKGLEDYDVWLVGSFAEKQYGNYKGVPRDLDIVLTGELQDEETLKYIMQHGVKMGFEHRLFVDLMWSTEILAKNQDTWTPFCSIRIGKTFTKILGDKVTVKEYKGDDEKRLDCGLHAFCFREPPSYWFKLFTRHQDGHYQNVVKNVRDIFE